MNVSLPLSALQEMGAPPKKRNYAERRLCVLINKHVRPMLKPGVWFGRWPNGGKFPPKTASLLKAEGLEPGPPDYIAVNPKGGIHGIEVKLDNSEIYGTEKTYQSSEQRDFEEAWIAAGGRYVVVRSLKEALDYCELWGITRADRSFIPAKGRGTP